MWLLGGVLESDPSHYKSRTLHVDRESGITSRVLAWRRGQTAILLPPDDIHEVSCLTDDAVSIHIYRRALKADEPSMLHAYERGVAASAAPPAAHASDI